MKIGYLMQEGGPDVRQSPLPGSANHVWQVFNELKALGHQMRLIARYDGKIWSSDDLRHFEQVVVHNYDNGLFRLVERLVRGIQSRLSLPYANLFESLRFAAACRQELAGYELLYERLGWMGYGGGLAARWMKIPLIVEANNGDFITELERLGIAPHGFQRWLAIALMKRAVHRVNFVVASGEGHRERFIEWWDVSPQGVTVVENGTELVDMLSRDQLRSFQIPEELSEVRIVYVGGFKPWHGLNILIPAMKKVVMEQPSVSLTLIGHGTQWDEIVKLIHDSNLDHCVELTGLLGIRKVADYLVKSDIAVSPYCGWMEFSGLKLFDYKAAGLAIVASGQDGHPKTLKHGHTGWIVPPCDVDSLSEAIVGLVSNSELRRRMGQAARIDAEGCHSWRHTAEELEKIFVEVIKNVNAKEQRGDRGHLIHG